MEKGLMFICSFLIFFSLINLVSAERLLSDANVSYDSRIEDKFTYQNKVYVSILLKDESGIVINWGTKEERKEQLIERDKWYQTQIDEVLNTLSEEDFVLHTKLPKGFGGYITQEGFEKFKQDKRFDTIALNDGGIATMSDSNYINLGLFSIILIIVIVFYTIKRKEIKKC